MSRIESGHPDCYVDCAAGGYAIYRKPYGPCKTGCDSERLSSAIAELLEPAERDLTFSGRVVGVSGETLAAIARDLGTRLPSFAADDRDWVANLDAKARFDLRWDESSLAQFIETVAEATGRPRTEAAF